MLQYIFDQYDTRTISGLHALTLECASLAFHKAFRLDWSRINTSVAEPDKVVEAYEVLFDLNTDLSVDAISDEVSRKLFKYLSLSFWIYRRADVHVGEMVSSERQLSPWTLLKVDTFSFS